MEATYGDSGSSRRSTLGARGFYVLQHVPFGASRFMLEGVCPRHYPLKVKRVAGIAQEIVNKDYLMRTYEWAL